MNKPDFQEVAEDLFQDEHFAAVYRRLKGPRDAGEVNRDLVVVSQKDINALLAYFDERESRIGWFTTCKNCSALWDKVYEYDMERQILKDTLNGLAGGGYGTT